MNTLRRISRHMAQAVAAGAVLVAAGLPAAVAGASTTSPTLTGIELTSSFATYMGAAQSVQFGTGASGYVDFAGTNFAANQGTGGTVTVSTTATGVTFNGALETSTSAGYVSMTTSPSTPTGFYPLTLTDANGSVTLANALLIVAGPSLTSVTGNSGVAGASTSASVTVAGSFTGTPTASVVSATGAPTLGSTSLTTTGGTIAVNVSAATAGSYTIVLTDTAFNGSLTIPFTVIGSTNPVITAVTPASGLGIPGTSSGPSTQMVTLTGTNFQNGATVSLGAPSSPTTLATGTGDQTTLAKAATLAIASTYSLTGDTISGNGVTNGTTVTNTAGSAALTLSAPTTAWLTGPPFTISGATTGNVTTNGTASMTATLTVLSAAGINVGMTVTGGNLNPLATYTVVNVSSLTVTLTASASVTQTAAGSSLPVAFSQLATVSQTPSASVVYTSATGVVLPGLVVSGTGVFVGSTVSSISGTALVLSHVTTAPILGTGLTFTGAAGESVSNTVVNSATSITFSVTVQAGVTAHQDTVTVRNPDGGTTTTSVGALGIGEAGAALSSSSGPVAPSISISQPFGSLTPGSTSVFTVTGSSAFAITTGATVTLTLAGDTATSPHTVAGTVTSVYTDSNGNYVATVNAPLPRFLTTPTTAAYTSGTSLSVADCAGITNGAALTVVDGTSSETTIASACTNGVVTIAALANAHAAGVNVEFATPSGAVWTVSVNNGTSTQSASSLVTGAPANPSLSLPTLTPGTWTDTATVPGFKFTTGASVVFPTGASSGVSGTVTSASGDTATLSITVAATTPVTATVAGPLTTGQRVVTLTTTGTAPVVGQTLVIDPLTTSGPAQTVTVASLTGTGPYTVTLNQALASDGGSTISVSGITTPQTGANVGLWLFNGSGQALYSNALLSTLVTPTVTASPSSVPAGIGTLDPANVTAPNLGSATANTIAFSGFGTQGSGYTCSNGYSALPNLGCAQWTVTSTNPAVTFTVASVTSGGVVNASPSVKPGTPATASVPVTISNGFESGSTTIAITAGPTISSVTAVGTLNAGIAASESEQIGILGTGFSTTFANSVAFVTASGAVDTKVSANVIYASATTLTVQVTALAGALNGTDSIMVETPATSTGFPGESVPLAGALKVVAPTITSATPATMPVLGASNNLSGLLNTYQSAFATTGFSANGFASASCLVAGNGTSTSATGTLPTCGAAYVVGSTTQVTVTFTYAAGGSTAGGVIVTLIDVNGQQSSIPMTIVATPTASGVVVTNASSTHTIAKSSVNVPFVISGSNFLPGTTVSIPATDGTVSGVVVNSAILISGQVSLLSAPADANIPFTITNPNGASVVTTLLAANITPAPTIFDQGATGGRVYTGLSGAKGSLTITGSGFVTGAVVSATTAGLVTFGTAVVNSPTSITVPVTYVSFTGTTPISTTLTVTNPTGFGAVTGTAGDLVINAGPVVTGTYYVPTFSTNVQVMINGSGFQPGMTATSSNAAYTAILVNVTPATATLLVTTTSAATAGTSSQITFTNPDGGSVTFALNGGPVPVVMGPLSISSLSTFAKAGQTRGITIHGSGFVTGVSIASGHSGIFFKVVGVSANAVRVQVTVAKTVKAGWSRFVLTNGNGARTSKPYQHM